MYIAVIMPIVERLILLSCSSNQRVIVLIGLILNLGKMKNELPGMMSLLRCQSPIFREPLLTGLLKPRIGSDQDRNEKMG